MYDCFFISLPSQNFRNKTVLLASSKKISVILSKKYFKNEIFFCELYLLNNVIKLGIFLAKDINLYIHTNFYFETTGHTDKNFG